MSYLKQMALPTRTAHLVCACVIAVAVQASADEPGKNESQGPAASSSRDSAIKFFRQHVLDRGFCNESVVKIDDGRIEAEFKGRTTYTNLQEDRHGFTVDCISQITQTNHALDEKGKRTGKSTKRNRVNVMRYHFGQMRSTGELIGYRRVLSSTFTDTPLGVSRLRVKVQPDELTVSESTVLYSDFFAANGEFKPGSYDVVSTFRVKDGALSLSRSGKGYNIDAETLKRTSVSDEWSFDYEVE